MDALAANYGRRLRYAINPQVICCESQDGSGGVGAKRPNATPGRATAW